MVIELRAEERDDIIIGGKTAAHDTKQQVNDNSHDSISTLMSSN